VSILNSIDNFIKKCIFFIQEALITLNYTLSHFPVKGFLIPFLFIFLIVSFSTPLFGLIFSTFIAWLCVIIPLLKRSMYLPVILIILFISNVFDPNILFVKSPFHSGILEIINPNQLFSLAATIRICFDFFVKINKKNRISYLDAVYFLLFFMSIVSAFYGVQDNNERMLQSLMFFFNISVCLWFYESFLNLDRRNINQLISLLRGLGLASLILYVFDFPNTHISFLFIALSVMTIYLIVKSSKWYWYLLIPFIIFIIQKAVLHLSFTTFLIIMSSIMIGILSLKKTKVKIRIVNLTIFIIIGIQALVFYLPLTEIQTVLAPDVNDPYIHYDNVNGFWNRVIFKLSLDRLPLWLGAIDSIKENFLIASAGASFFPVDFGAFARLGGVSEWASGAHQFQLELMLNYGLVGAVLYWLIWVSLMKRLSLAIFSNDYIIKFLSVSLLAYFIPSSFVANFIIQEHALAAWVLTGITIALHERQVYFNKKMG
jgi:hypothetical protein